MCLWLLFPDRKHDIDKNPITVDADDCNVLFESLLSLARTGLESDTTLNDALSLLNEVIVYAAARVATPNAKNPSPHAVLPKQLVLNPIIACFNKMKKVLSCAFKISKKSIMGYEGIFPPIELSMMVGDMEEHLGYFVDCVHTFVNEINWPKSGDEEGEEDTDVFSYLLRGGKKYMSLLRLAVMVAVAGLFASHEENNGYVATQGILPIAARHGLLKSNLLYWIDMSLFFGAIWKRNELMKHIEEIESSGSEASECCTESSSSSLRIKQFEARTSLQMAAGVFASLRKYVQPEEEQGQALAACLGISSDPPKIEEELSGYKAVLKNYSTYSNMERLNLVFLLRRPSATEAEIVQGLYKFISTCDRLSFPSR